MLGRGLVALACALIAATAAGQAQAAPKPEPSPSRARTIHPQAAPDARTAQKTSNAYESSSSSISSAPASSSPAQPYRPAVISARPHVRTVQNRPRRAAKSDPAPKPPSQPVASIASTGGEILATSAQGLTKAPSSSETLLLLLVGLALVLLVVGETTFLRLAARGAEPRRAAEEQLPIRRVQLRR